MTTAETIAEGLAKLEGPAGEVTLDFSSVNRINSSELRALESLAAQASQKSVKLALYGVNVEVYRVLKVSGGRALAGAGLKPRS
jgi:anti-anti-sigma regulatory factor